MVFDIEENGLLEEDIPPVVEGMADLLKEDDELVGACIKSERKDCFEINHIGIKEECRGNGKGTEFVRMYESMSKARGYNRIQAKVEEGNVRGINFWENHAEWTRGKNIEGQWVYYKNL